MKTAQDNKHANKHTKHKRSTTRKQTNKKTPKTRIDMTISSEATNTENHTK